MNNKIEVTVPSENGWVKEEIPVPDDQAWLYHMLARQTDALKSMRTMLQFFVVVVILGVIIQGCNILLSVPLR